MPDTTKLVGVMNDERGMRIDVYQDHEGVRIDVGGIEIMLSKDGEHELRDLLISAGVTASFWAGFHG
jgi:hypothetical protein